MLEDASYLIEALHYLSIVFVGDIEFRLNFVSIRARRSIGSEVVELFSP